MRLSKLAVALTSLFVFAGAVAIRQQSDGELEPPAPWQVTKLSTFSPSGRPGSSPLARILANVTNPSAIPAGPGASSPSFAPSEANCTVEWAWADAQPYGAVHECTTAPPAEASSSKWTVEILESDPGAYAPTEKLDVKFTLTLTSSSDRDGEAYSKVLVATQHFEVGDNMRGTCGGSGVCSWGLNEELTPLSIQPTIACEGTC
ncbi:hypothetical protein F4821DRAFT_89311 [Hypoxylon rubiginosum]|uniref:Uncharacterized protein n=1 Tax=Hypoxylon rubiginosum TaxID=110542 RepID=A0ACC0D718_9PEZI|nr:hypothetical protein F4821DRAFT_89311 [Hypoxylon rubiginosum]